MNMIKSKSVLIEVDKEVNTASELISLAEESSPTESTRTTAKNCSDVRGNLSKRFTL